VVQKIIQATGVSLLSVVCSRAKYAEKDGKKDRRKEREKAGVR
jgi:hypothetical protein